MSYLVIARKWRPQTWKDVVAQEHVTATLQNAIQHDRLAHAYLFTGPRGVGKTSAARILAKTLNCENADKNPPCDTCTACQEISEGRSVDVFEIDGASNRGIDEIRNLRENIRYTPARGKYRIYIIDEVHMLTSPAFNALLKTLEEPPAHVLFIFATTEPHKVPATILSRCQRFDFHRIKPQDIVDRLKMICQEEKIEVEEEALHIIARKADGSMRDGQSILDQIISYKGEKITVEDVVQGLGLIRQDLFFQVTDVLASKDMPSGMQLIEKVMEEGYDIGEFLSGLTEHLRNLLVVRSLDSADLVEASEEDRKRYRDIAKSFREEDILRLIRIVLDAQMSLRRSTNPRLPLELAIVKMIKLDKTVTIEDLLMRLEGVEPSEKGEKKPPNIPEKQPEPPAPKEKPQSPPTQKNNPGPSVKKPEEDQKKSDLTLDEVQSQWEELIQRVKHRKITVGSFLQEGVLLGVESNTIQIGFPLSNGFHVDAIERSRDLILEELRALFGPGVSFRCVKKDLPKREASFPQEKQKADLEALKEKDPVLKKIVDDLDAKIVD